VTEAVTVVALFLLVVLILSVPLTTEQKVELLLRVYNMQ